MDFMKKFIALLLCSLISLNCKAWWSIKKLEDALAEHQKAFKDFEPEAKDIKVRIDTQYY